MSLTLLFEMPMEFTSFKTACEERQILIMKLPKYRFILIFTIVIRLQTLRECFYKEETLICTCFSVLLDSHNSTLDEGN